MKLIAGIDPGLSGAIALYDIDHDLAPNTCAPIRHIEDMPTFEVRVGKKFRRRIDASSLARFFDAHSKDIALAIIELVGPTPRDGVAGAFAFGKAAGLIEGIIAANFIPIHPVAPTKWKRDLKLIGDKDESRAMASRMFPRASGLWPLKKHDGRAEATLLAWYGVKLKERGEL